ncbi:histone-lysine N-methyltransferase SETMAR [Elysia marginata]|uniref:Histone-lysine N-methyltransferase SETMAR n=1 Tax=Elysia marginata TaxID=1093978 RepID=A0AAV4FN57_9GAST|nr:histone-lysine N-methyltransferase SETMAR [Elysia marginata]
MWRVIKLGGVTRSEERKMASSMDLRLKQRTVIEFLTAEGCSPIEIYSRMKAVYGDMCLDVSIVRRWARRSWEENPSESTVHDQVRTGRPLSASDSKHQSRVDQLIRENRRVKQIDISIERGIFQESVHHIITNLLGHKSLEQGNTVNFTKYVNTVEKLKARLRRVRGEKVSIIHHDNARPHTSLETRTALDRLGLRTLPHPPYSPDLAPSDFFLFPKLKNYLKGNHYETDEDVKNAVLSWCRDKTADFFADSIQQVARRWRLCFERDGDYVEK